MKQLLITVFLFVIPGSAAYAQLPHDSNNTVLWAVIGSEKDTSYLFGTFHEFGPSYFDDYPVIKEKLETAECLLMETVADSLGRYIGKKEPRHEGDLMTNSWLSKLSVAEQKWLQRYFEKRGLKVKLTAFALYPPSVLLSMIRSLVYIDQCSTWTIDDDMPMEEWLANYSMVRNVRLVGLQNSTQDQQMAQRISADSLNASDIDKLKDFIHNRQRYYDRVKDCSAAENYLHHTIDYHFSEDANLPNPALAATLSAKCDEWLPVVRRTMKQYKTFIATRLSYLCYKNGLIARLIAAGYKVIPVSMKK